jgi:isopenicillin-N N-acyltransferase-like protein
MIDCGFPVIRYPRQASFFQWGRLHGESYRSAIAELAAIRTELMQQKNAGLTADRIAELANQQWAITELFAADLAAELRGIADGANVSLCDLVVLNNYTDFRDIQLVDQGCSLAYVNTDEGLLAGQTWDMHRSAKNYVCCLEIPEGSEGCQIVFSVVGCVGMMGYNSRGGMVGVNNLNTQGARPGALWPVIVRGMLSESDVDSMAQHLVLAPKTSGRNYLLAVQDSAQMWEAAPDCSECVQEKQPGELGFMFHTNHCLGLKMRLREMPLAQNSTTHVRFELLEKKMPAVRDWQTMIDLLNDHENYPKSICSNYQANAQDPSVTCGGAVGNLTTGRVRMWRGDALHDENFVLREFELADGVQA